MSEVPWKAGDVFELEGAAYKFYSAKAAPNGLIGLILEEMVPQNPDKPFRLLWVSRPEDVAWKALP